MIDAMHERLERWARWAASGRRVIGLGYARCTLAERTSRPASDPYFNEEASDTDSAVSKLPIDLGFVVRSHYLDQGTVAQKARDCGCCRESYYDRLHYAHVRLGDLCKVVRDDRLRVGQHGIAGMKKSA